MANDVDRAQLEYNENLRVLSKVIASEAGDEQGKDAQYLVGWAIINRMKLKGKKRVEDVVRGAFVQRKSATNSTLRIARDLLDGTAPDISQGITHFYTPEKMPKEGDIVSKGADIGGGLEQVVGVMKAGKSVRSYKPRWAREGNYVQFNSIKEKNFKFYKNVHW